MDCEQNVVLISIASVSVRQLQSPISSLLIIECSYWKRHWPIKSRVFANSTRGYMIV